MLNLCGNSRSVFVAWHTGLIVWLWGSPSTPYVRELRYPWVTLQHFATVMLQIGEWVTHPFSRHILTHYLWVTAPASSWVGSAEEWREKESLTWVEHRVLLHQDTRDRPGFTAIGWGASRGGFHDSAAASWHRGSSAISLSPLLSFSLSLSAILCPSASVQTSGGWYTCVKADHFTTSMYGKFWTWDFKNMACYERYSLSLIFPHTKSRRQCLFSLSSSLCLFTWAVVCFVNCSAEKWNH